MQTSVSFSVEAQLAIKLLGLLESEQSVLLSSKVDAMEKLLEDKFQLLNELSSNTQKRYQMLAGKGYDANETGMKKWLAEQNETSLLMAWSGFQETLSRSKETNRVNGILVTKQFNRNQQMLIALQGSTNGGGFYGPNGQAANSSSMRNGLMV